MFDLPRAVALSLAASLATATVFAIGGLTGTPPVSAAIPTFGSCAQCEGAAGGPNGDTYAADINAHEIRVFDSGETQIATWGSFGSADGQFEEPWGVAVDPSGDVFVADGGRSIQEFTSSGEFVQAFGGSATGVAVTPTDDVYAVSGTTMSEYDSTGTQLNTWAFGNNGLPTAGDALAVAYSTYNGGVYVTDERANRVYQFDNTGEFVGTWQFSQGTGPSQMGGPGGIAVDGSGNVYVSDPEASSCNICGQPRIEEFSPNGTFESSYTTSWQVDGMGYANGYLYGGTFQAVTRISLSLPVAAISASPSTPQTSQSVTFNASGAYLPFGTITDYRWDLDGSGQFTTDTGVTPTVSEVFNHPGTTTVSVRVTGSSGVTATALVAVMTSQSNAKISAPSSALTGHSVTFDASGSALSNSSITDYLWDLTGSGRYTTDTGTIATVSESFSSPGTYTVGVQVTRAGGDVDTATTSIKITPAPPGGYVGVSINNGDYATDTDAVQLDLVWPAGATSALISNDGGFNAAGNTKTLSLAATVNWNLEKRGSDRLPKTVYVRFLGAGVDTETFTDNVVYDETTPTISDATFLRAAGLSPQSKGKATSKKARPRTYLVKIQAADAKSGVSTVETSLRPRGGKAVNLRSPRHRGLISLNQVVRVTSQAPPKYARVRSASGRWSRWLEIAAAR